MDQKLSLPVLEGGANYALVRLYKWCIFPQWIVPWTQWWIVTLNYGGLLLAEWSGSQCYFIGVLPGRPVRPHCLCACSMVWGHGSLDDHEVPGITLEIVIRSWFHWKHYDYLAVITYNAKKVSPVRFNWEPDNEFCGNELIWIDNLGKDSVGVLLKRFYRGIVFFLGLWGIVRLAIIPDLPHVSLGCCHVWMNIICH